MLKTKKNKKMKVTIGTSFLRKQTNELLKVGDVIEDFTESELLSYEGLYSENKITEEENTETKTTLKKSKQKK